MTLKAMVVSTLATTLLACSGQAPPKQDVEPDGAYGTIALNLIGRDRQGRQYRLRQAEFDISPYYYYPPGGNPETITLSTETDPDSATLEARVLPGTYLVTLSNRFWFLERLTEDGPEPIEKSVLLSEQSVYAYVYDRSVSDVYFRFGVDGEVIDFRHGDIRINIEVETRDEDGGVPPPDEDAGTP